MAETEYEKYLKTTPLLGLQKPSEELVCHAELSFQIIHQVEELWMKLIQHELALAVRWVNEDRFAEARVPMTKIRELCKLMSDQMRVLELLSPLEYFKIRAALGRGSGQESPGFNALLEQPAALRSALKAALKRNELALIDLHRDPTRSPEIFQFTEAMLDFDAAFQNFRYQHLALVRRIIGGQTPSLKGAPSHLLEIGHKQTFFPELWFVRETLFRDFVPGPSLDDDSAGGAH